MSGLVVPSLLGPFSGGVAAPPPPPPPPPPTSLYSDDFTASNQEVSAYRPSWQYAENSSGITINANRLDLNSAAGPRTVFNTNTLVQNATIDFDAICAADGVSVGSVFRLQDGGNFYLLDLNRSGNNLQAGFYKKVGGSYTQLGNTVIPVAAGFFSAAFPVRITLSRQNFTLRFNGYDYLFQDASNAFPSTGYIGFRNGGGSTGGRLADNFVVTQLATPAVPPVWNFRYARMSLTAMQDPGNGQTIFQELALLAAGGASISGSGGGGSIVSGPTTTGASLNALIDGNTAGGTPVGITFPWSAPMIFDFGAGRGSGGTAISQLAIYPWVQGGSPNEGSYRGTMAKAFTIDGANSPSGPWTNFLTITNDDPNTGYGTADAPQGKGFPFPL